MDWDAIDDEMYKVAPEFKDPRFDSLRLVLSIVGSVNAEAKVEELRSQRERVEDLVDDVVQAYHNGFNKAIHNYSRILHLFSESKEQVEKLRICLEEARRRLGAQSRSLQQQWRRGITLGDTVRLLGDVNSISDAPQRVQKLEEAKDWEAAVDVLLEACNKLARRELDNVGALRDIKRDMALRRNSLHKQLVHELEDRVFVSVGNPKGTSGNPDDPEGDEDDARSLSVSLIRSDSLLALIASQNKSKDVAATPRGKDASLLSASSSNFSTSSGSKGLERSSSLLARTAALKLAESKPLPPLPMAKIVECLVKLGGIAEAQLTLRRHMPTQVRNVILRALQQSQIDKAAAAVGTHAAAARAAQMAVECVFDHCLQMLRSLIEVLKLLNGARPSASSAGLELLLAARSTEDVSTQLPPKLVVQQYVRREAEAAWDCLQAECRRLLQELLRAPQLQASTISAAYQSSAGWLRGAADGSGSLPTSSGTHTFSFDVQVSGMAPQQVLDRMQSMAPMRPTETMAQQALGGQTGGTYLAPALYRPVVQFVDGARRALEAAEGESDQPGTPTSKEREAAAKVLRTSLETFISEEFLPEVYVNFRWGPHSYCATRAAMMGPVFIGFLR
ncbi:probable exocyst complex component 4 at N-terminal half [Coccomyxa sp. Obi]|nr:probable exocyst complex component 4 at N-terminal half [Coccomyxa sp. Obi]